VTLTRYATLVIGAVALPLGIIALLWGGEDPHAVRSAAFGAGLAGLNTIVAYALALWAQRGSNNVFLGAVLGGMLGRMALMLGAVAVGLGMLDLRRLPLVAGLLSYFVLFLAVELMALNRRRPASELS
jgi:hypothetical protein